MFAPNLKLETSRDVDRLIHRRPKRTLQWLVAAAALVSVILVATHFSEGQAFVNLLRHLHPAWLVAALALQASTYVCQATMWRNALCRSGERLPLTSMIGLSIAQLFVEQAIPSADASGFIFVANALSQRGIRRPVIATAIMINVLTYCTAYLLALIAGISIFYFADKLDPRILRVAVTFLVGAASLCALLFVFAFRGFPRTLPLVGKWRPIATLLEVLSQGRIGASQILRGVLASAGLQLAIFALDASSVWALLFSVGSYQPPAHVFAAFMMASLARTIGVTPGGIGTFEAASISALVLFGAPTAAALAATLLFRGFSFWLPMLPGVALARRETKRYTPKLAEAQ